MSASDGQESVLTSEQRLEAIRWALGLDVTDTRLDAEIHAALAEMARRYPDVSDYEQRYRALDMVHQSLRGNTHGIISHTGGLRR